MSWNTVLLGLIAIYLTLVHALRYRRRDSIIHRFSPAGRQSLSTLSLADAHSIVLDLATLEFPCTFSGSIFFALFKLSSSSTASKHAADTGFMITETVLNAPSSPRVIDGVARMDYLSGRYRKAGKITDDDMLYTLGLFALEPVRWNAVYDWRVLTDVEECAHGVFWRDMGEAMEISYEQLRPYMGVSEGEGSDAGDGLAWMDALQMWCDGYEIRHMLPAVSNKRVAKATLDIAVFNVTTRLRGVAVGLVSALLEPRLRRAMTFEDPPIIYAQLLTAVLNLRKWLYTTSVFPDRCGSVQSGSPTKKTSPPAGTML
ncbi:Uu.00g065640.m01.CDS01 [Anthostomella pinea]|uniref:Uu.00g065640.m01.CDS01 n=1 Tax=Anthostomella pinea TaxID=933095 RepID=A0AAI8YN35_9PEZI|nr:Uu.00g065640.m01.CDS01 [Anthostomella pinea]